MVGNNFLDITLNISKFYMEKSYRALRKVNNRTDWTEHSGVTSVNAYYNIIENSIRKLLILLLLSNQFIHFVFRLIFSLSSTLSPIYTYKT